MSEIDKEKLTEELKRARQRVAELEGALADSGRITPLNPDIFRRFAESATDSFTIWDTDRRLIYANDATLKYFPAGTKNSDLLNKHFSELIPDAMETNQYERFIGTVQSEKPLYIEDLVAPQKFGSVRLSIKGFTLENGIGVIATDITERKHTEEALKRSEETFRGFMESATDSFSIWDSNLKLVYLNDATLIKYYPPGTKRADIIGKHFTELVPGTRESGRYEKYLNVLNTGNPFYSDEFTPHPRFGNMYLAIRVFKIENGLGIITIDNTERKRMEDDLRESQGRLSALVENAPDIIFSYDLNGRFLYGNKKVKELLGYAPEELIGKSIAETGLLSEEGLLIAMARVEENRRGIVTGPDEYELTTKNGSLVFIEASGVPIARGDKTEVLCIAHDITERKRIEEELRQSEEKLRFMFSSLSDAITVVDLSARIIDANEAAIRTFECNSKNEAIGMNSLDFIAVKDRERAIGEFANTLKTMRGELREYKLLAMGGREFDGEINTNVLKDKSGDSAGFICITRDITERKQMEEKLRQSEEKFRVIFNTIADGISVIDLATGNIIDTNEAALRMFNFTKEDVIGHPAYELIAEKDREKAMVDLQKTLEKGRSGLSEWCLLGKGGTEHDCEASSAVIRDQSGNPMYLVNVMRDISERKRMEEKLRQSEEKLRRIFESIGDSITIIDLNGKIVDANETAIRMSGGKREDHIGRYGFDLLAERDRARAAKDMMEAFNAGYSNTKEYTIVKKDGSEFPAETASTVLRDAKGEPVGIINILRDITERKQMQEKLQQSEEKIRQIFNSVGVGISVTNMEGKVAEVNDFGLRLCGCSKEEMIGHNGIRFIAERDRPRIIKEMVKAFETGKSGVHEFTSLKKDGTEYETETIVTVMHDSSGKPTGLIASVTDITERKRIERELHDYKANLENMVKKRTADLARTNERLRKEIAERESVQRDLRETDELLNVFFENAPDIIYMHDAQGKTLYINKVAEDIIGISRNDIIGHNVFNFGIIPTDNAPFIQSELKSLLTKEGAGRAEVELTTMSGGKLFLEAVSFTTVRKGEQTVIGIARDITERKKAEAALQEKEALLRSFFNSPGLICGIVELEADDVRYITVNAAMAEMYSLPPEAMANKLASEVGTDKDIVRLFIENYKKSRENDAPAYFEYQRGVGQKKRWLYVTVTFLGLEPDSHQPRYAFVTTDITERRKAEEALRESEEWHRTLVETTGRAGLGMAIIQDLEGRGAALVSVNDVTCEMSGYSREELLKLSVNDLMPLDISGQIMSNYRTRQQGAPMPHSYEMAFVRKDKVRVPIMVSVALMQLHGKPTTVAFFRDITERKQMEEALRESEEKYRGIFDESIATIYVFDAKKNFINTNQAGLDLLGYSREELLRMSIPDVDADPVVVLPAHQELLTGGRLINYEHRLRRKDGAIVSVLNNSRPLTDSQGKIIGMLSTLVDITERKRIEEDLRESEERLRGFFENVPDILFAHNMEGQFTDMNKKALEISGYSRDEIIGKNILETGIIPPDQLEGVIVGIKGIEDGKSGYPYEVQLAKKNGERITVEAVSFPIRRKGRLEVMGIAHDITGRKAAEEALRASQEKLRAIFEAIEDGIAVADLEGKLIDMNESDIRLFGYERKEQLLNVNSFQFVTETDRPRVISDMSAVLTIGSGKVDQYRLMDKNGTEFDAEVSGSLLRDNQGKPTAIVNIIRDITERKRMEEALKESEAKYRTLVEQSEQGICILQDGRIVFANKALSKLNGYSLKEMYVMPPEELLRLTVHPDDREAYIKRVRDRLEGKRLRPRHEYRVIRKDGTVIWFETFSKRITYRGRPAIQSTMVDITERKQWESNLQQSKSDLSFYLSQINQAQEEERKRIARELHDETIQEIIALSRQLDNLIDKKIGPDEERRENRRRLEEAQHKVDTILKGIRRFTRDLRPSILDDLGLVPALEWLTSDLSEQFKIPIKLSIRGKEQHIASDAALAMYRISQESLRNACRHSGATRIQVNLTYTNKTVTLNITDNGQGFDLPEDTASLIRRGKLGVAGMYERAQLIDANLSIKPRKNKGTAVTLEVYIK